MESLIIRRVLVVGVMPKRRKDSAICGGRGTLVIGCEVAEGGGEGSEERGRGGGRGRVFEKWGDARPDGSGEWDM